MTIFDVETTSLPDAELEAVKPSFKAPKNFKDPLKIAAAVAEAETEWKANAALDAKTARILAIGLLGDDGEQILTGAEAGMLEAFWERWDAGERMVGFAIKHFDLPMLWQRSVILGVDNIPHDLMAGRYWSSRFTDLMEVWTCFGKATAGQSLDAICRALKIGQKSGNGADFGKLFSENQEAARAYLSNDLTLTAALAARLGVV